MKFFFHFSFYLLIFFLLGCNSNRLDQNEILPLFVEEMDNWKEYGEAEWTFNDGIIKGEIDTGAGFLMTNEKFSDFELTLEFNPDSTINSGVFVRCQSREISPQTCYEMNIWDLHPNQDFRTGAIVTKQIPIAKVNTINKWNTYKIICSGNELNVYINDTLTASMIDTSLSSGYIAIQSSGKGVVEFKNVKIKNQ